MLLAVQPVDSPARLRRRGHLLTAVEHGAGLYRMLPPTPLWVGFYAQASVGSILQTGLAGAYLLVKAQQVVERARLGAAATLALLTPAGQPPSAEEAQEAGGVCPICQVRAVPCRWDLLVAVAACAVGCAAPHSRRSCSCLLSSLLPPGRLPCAHQACLHPHLLLRLLRRVV